MEAKWLCYITDKQAKITWERKMNFNIFCLRIILRFLIFNHVSHLYLYCPHFRDFMALMQLKLQGIRGKCPVETNAGAV